MNKTEKFLNFLESIKTEENAPLIENVTKGFNTICEFGGTSFSVAPQKVIGGKGSPISSNVPSSNVINAEEMAFDNAPEAPEDIVPDVEGLPDAGEMPEAVKEHLKEDIIKLLANPDFKDTIKELLLEENEI